MFLIFPFECFQFFPERIFQKVPRVLIRGLGWIRSWDLPVLVGLGGEPIGARRGGTPGALGGRRLPAAFVLTAIAAVALAGTPICTPAMQTAFLWRLDTRMTIAG